MATDIDSALPLEAQPEADDGPNIKYWLAQLEAAKRAAEPSLKDADDAWSEYLNKGRQKPLAQEDKKEPAVRYPIYWASVRTIQPALYSRTPVPTTQRTIEAGNDPIANLASIALERLAKYLMRACPFDRVMYATRDDFIHCGKTTNRVFYEAQISEEPKKEYYTQIQGQDPTTGQPVAQWVDSEGQPPPEGAELQEDEVGVFAESSEESLEHCAVQLLPVYYTDILHTPNARHWDELQWIAFKSMLTYQDVQERFGEEWADKLRPRFAKLARRDTQDSRDDDSLMGGLYLGVWEIWDKRRREVYWHAEGQTEEFIDRKEDPYELDGFFPCPPFMLGTVGCDNLYPVPDYVQLKPCLTQLHGLSARLKILTRAAKVRGVADEQIKEAVSLASRLDDAEYVFVKDLARLVGDKSLENLIVHFPTEKITAAVAQIAQVLDLYEAKFNEIYGIPDILRGVSDPNETAAAQQLKGRFLSLRFSATQREFQRIVRDAIELMCDLALRKFPDDKLIEVCGVRYMDQQQQALWPQALLLLRDDDERKVRIDIETDSTITMNEDAEIEQRNYLAKTFFDGLAAVSAAGDQMPEFKPLGMHMLLYVIQGLRKGKEIETNLRQMIDQSLNAPPPEPQPDPAVIKAQASVQAMQMKTQGQLQLEQMKTQAEIERDNVKAQNAMAVEQGQLQHDATVMQLRMELERFKEEMKIQLAAITAAAKIKTDKQATDNKLKADMAKHAFSQPPPGDVHIHVGGESK